MNGVEVNELNEEILNKNVNEDNVIEIVRKKFYWWYEFVLCNHRQSNIPKCLAVTPLISQRKTLKKKKSFDNSVSQRVS